MISFSDQADADTSSEDYARRFSGSVGSYLLEVQTRILLDLLKPHRNASVLDVGGGHAQTAVPLTRNGYDVTVVGSTIACRDRLDRLLPEGSFGFRTADFPALPFPDRHFDVVVSFRLISHAVSWQELVSEMCRVARCAVVLDYADRQSANLFSSVLFNWKKSAEGNTRHYRLFHQNELQCALMKSGFEVRRVQPEFFFPMVLHRVIGKPRVSHLLETGSSALGLTRSLGSPVVLYGTPVGTT